MVLDYNKMPEPAVRLTDEKLINQIYDAMIDFFTFCILEHESRQVFYEKDNIYSGTFNIRIFWINKEKGLGYGIAEDWKAGKIQVYARRQFIGGENGGNMESNNKEKHI